MSSDPGEAKPGDLFSNPLPILSIVGLWGLNIVLGSIFWVLLYGRKRPPTLWDEKSKKSLCCFGQNNYLIRIRTGKCTINYDLKSTNLKFHIFDDKKKKLGSIIIPPKWLRKYSRIDSLSNMPDVRILQFNWRRAQEISNFCFIQASHTCRIPNSSIVVYDVDVRSQAYGLAIRTIIGVRVESLQDSNEEDQMFQFKSLKVAEDDIFISPGRFSFCHFTIVGLFYTSTVAIIALAGPNDFTINDVTVSMINGLIAVPICLILSLVSILTRSFLRKFLYPFSGPELANFDMSWSAVWLMDAFGMAVYSFYETSQFEETQIHQWTYASAIGQLLTTSLMVIIYLINDRVFKSKKKEMKNDRAVFGDLSVPVQEKTDLNELVSPKAPRSTESTGSRFYREFLKDNKMIKVKSISQYGNVTHI